MSRYRHILGNRPPQPEPGWLDRWLVAGTLVGEPYPRWIPRKKAVTSTDGTTTVVETDELVDTGQLDLEFDPDDTDGSGGAGVAGEVAPDVRP